jgi:hypothetical protein
MSEGHYTITLNHEQRLVHVSAQGEFDLESGQELITDARENATEHQYHILCDVRASRAKVSLADWFFLPRRLAVYKNMKTRRNKTAIVVTAGRQENVYRFFETVASNMGLWIKIFLREEDALEWLVVQVK